MALSPVLAKGAVNVMRVEGGAPEGATYQNRNALLTSSGLSLGPAAVASPRVHGVFVSQSSNHNASPTAR
jgi:hypothetical protein